jgi:membrane-associated phospholipid phosphatase
MISQLTPSMERDGETDRFFRSLYLWAFLGCALLFCPVALWNKEVFSAINGLHSPVSDAMWLAFTTLGDGLVLAVIAGALIPSKPRATAFAIALLMLSSFVVHPVKWIAKTPRPVKALDAVHSVGPRLRSDSFPSGHSAAAMAAALGLGHYCRNPWTAGAVLGTAALVGLSRVGVGAHFPADALGGFLIAFALYWASGLFLWPTLEKVVPRSPPFSSKWFRAAFFAELGAAACVFFVYSEAFAESPTAARVTAFLALSASVWGVCMKHYTVSPATPDPSPKRGTHATRETRKNARVPRIT